MSGEPLSEELEAKIEPALSDMTDECAHSPRSGDCAAPHRVCWKCMEEILRAFAREILPAFKCKAREQGTAGGNLPRPSLSGRRWSPVQGTAEAAVAHCRMDIATLNKVDAIRHLAVIGLRAYREAGRGKP